MCGCNHSFTLYRPFFFFIQYEDLHETRYLKLYLQTIGLHKDDDPGSKNP